VRKIQVLQLEKEYIFFTCNFVPIFGHKNPGSGSGSSMTKNAGSGYVSRSARKPMRIRNTAENNECLKSFVLFLNLCNHSDPQHWYFLKEAGSDLCVEVRLEALLLYSESSVVELVFKRSGFGFC
jgi:hypothetical protein